MVRKKHSKITFFISSLIVLLLVLLFVVAVGIFSRINEANMAKKTTLNHPVVSEEGARVSIHIVRPDNLSNDSRGGFVEPNGSVDNPLDGV